MTTTQEEVVRGITTNPGIVVMLGASDRGKTTWCLELANALVKEGNKVGVVDGDIGQSDLGPPTTVSLGCLESPVQGWDEMTPQASFFVGTTSPIGHEGWCVAAVTRMVQAAWGRQCDVVLVDTTGLVQGRYGRQLKGAKLAALLPNHIVAVQKDDELVPLLAGWPFKKTQVWHLTPPEGIKKRDTTERQRLRQAAYCRYWRHGKTRRLSLDNLSCWRTRYRSARPLAPEELARCREDLGQELVYAETSDQGLWVVRSRSGHRPPRRTGVRWTDEKCFANLLVGLVGEDPDQVTVGIVEKVLWEEAKVQIFSPPVEEISGIIFGLMRVDRSGMELERLGLDDV